MTRFRPAPLAFALGLALLASGCGDQKAAVAADGIAAVQGAGERSAFEGQRARIEGVVTLSMADGAFVQSLQADADAASAEGLFVMPAEGQPALEVGQHVVAEGLVAESGDGAMLTTLADARIDVRGTTALPEPVVLAAPPADWEAFEGMRLRIEAPLTVTGNDALLRFGEVDLAFDGRLYTPTEIAAPGEAAIAQRADNRRRLLVLDDARSAQNPGNIAWLSAPLSGDAPLRAGSTLVGVQGVLDQRWGGYRLQADAVVGEIEQAPRPAAPSVEGAIRIAGMNLLNLFNGDGQGGGFPTERGAKDHDGYARQMAKHVTVITALDPAIIAAQELENDGFGPESAVQELADELNAAQPGADWTPVASEGRLGTDQITVGILYRADRVEAVGAPALATEGPFEYGSRPVLAQSFRVGDGPVFTVASVHFKSKGGCEDAQGADRDQGDGQACFNAKRVESAEAMHAWLATDPTGSGSDRVAAIGDYNAYAMEEPMQWLRDNGWQDAFARTDGAPQHSFVFDGQAGRLDHAMLSPSMAAMLRGAAKWPVNSDESIGFAYDGVLGRGEANEWRSSDHDPLLLGFDNTSAR
ncbi:ExeM/NucH family extracellular endonuclease [Silanimonas sp.]|jgi:predicted extracellular nuclease|uniref:ExeM/NucH family extracellular endonuclease n=1 Tax=Silanimonas sp. TaxID=1929290 RepID=UPI0037CADD38